MFERPKFEVTIYIDKVTHVPYSTGKLFVRWNVTESPRPDTKGRTPGVDVHRNSVQFGRKITFLQRIGTKTPSTTLRPCTITFEVVWEPLGSRGMPIGEISLDLSQYTPDPTTTHHLIEDPKNGKNALESDPEPRAYLLEHARANCLLSVGIGMRHVKGPTNYRVPAFTAPVVHNDYEDLAKTEDTLSKDDKSNHKVLAGLRDEILAGMFVSGCQVNVMDSVADLIRGGDGFNGQPPPKAVPVRDNAEEHKSGQPYLESVLRDNYVSWNVEL